MMECAADKGEDNEDNMGDVEELSSAPTDATTYLIAALPDWTEAEHHDRGESSIRDAAEDESITSPHRYPSRLSIHLIPEQLDRP